MTEIQMCIYIGAQHNLEKTSVVEISVSVSAFFLFWSRVIYVILEIYELVSPN